MKTNLITSMFIAALLVIATAPLLHPFGAICQGAVKQTGSTQDILSDAQIEAATQALFERSYQSCHSHQTTWPWYSYVPPASWLIERDVSRARASMNLSRWNQYSSEERQSHLGAIAAAVRSRQMPPRRFTLVHPETMLSPAERERIYAWARAERRRLRVSIHHASAIAHLP